MDGEQRDRAIIQIGHLFERQDDELDTVVSSGPYHPDWGGHALVVVSKLVRSVYKSAGDPERGDFAKGREQMAMHAIALLLGTDWKTIERILFGEDNGS